MRIYDPIHDERECVDVFVQLEYVQKGTDDDVTSSAYTRVYKRTSKESTILLSHRFSYRVVG